MYSHEEDIDSAIEVFSQAIQHYQSQQVGGAAVSRPTSGSVPVPRGSGCGGDDSSWIVSTF